MGCAASEARIKQDLAIGFAYYRLNDVVFLALKMENTGRHTMFGGQQLVFLVNGERRAPPLTIYREWVLKPFVPKAPKLTSQCLGIKELAEYLGVGDSTMEWHYGPAKSNAMVLRVHEDGGIEEVKVECPPDIRSWAESALLHRRGVPNMVDPQRSVTGSMGIPSSQ